MRKLKTLEFAHGKLKSGRPCTYVTIKGSDCYIIYDDSNTLAKIGMTFLSEAAKQAQAEKNGQSISLPTYPLKLPPLPRSVLNGSRQLWR